jgi:mannose-1-phosphate guanylyltransferase
VLAAGDGTRLAALTTDANGRLVPKQFCSLNGGGSLLQEAIQRASRIVPRERVCVIVADQHRHYWESTLRTLPSSNVIVQPRNCGTANGILLSVLTILERDPLARIVFLPATHYVYDESTLAGSLREAAILLTRNPDGVAILGIEPEKADSDLGYIVPGRKLADGTRSIDRFAEKPESKLAQQLFLNGALWNSFILAACGPALLGLFRARLPNVVRQMETVVAYDARLGRRAVALRELYECLPFIDFSREVVQGAESELRVIIAPACGWNDLGTPERVAVTLQRLRQERLQRVASPARIPSFVAAPAIINLAAQHARLDRAA